MKKILLMAAMAALTIPNGFARKFTIDIPMPDIKFGQNEIGCKCCHSGLCEIKWNSYPTKEQEGSFKGWYEMENNNFLIILKGSSLSDNEKSQYLNGSKFIFTNDQFIPHSDLLKFNIGTGRDVKINKGSYSYTIDRDGDYIVSVNLN